MMLMATGVEQLGRAVVAPVDLSAIGIGGVATG